MFKNIKVWLAVAAIMCIALLSYSFKNNVGLLSYVISHTLDDLDEPDEDTEVLRVGVRSDIPNFSSYNSTSGKYYGLEDEIAQELAKRLGYSGAQFIAVEPVKRVEALNNDKVDVVIGLYSVTDEREKQVDFSPSYYTDRGELIVENTSGFTELSNLRDRTVAVHTGSPSKGDLIDVLCGIGLISDKNEADSFINFKFLDSYEAMFNALEVGSVDAVVCDGAIANEYMNSDRYVLYTMNSVEYAAATKKGSEMSEKVSTAMQEMLDDGTIDTIEDKWSY